MSANPAVFEDDTGTHYRVLNAEAALRTLPGTQDSRRRLAASITKTASQQTYYTIRWLVDRDRTDEAYRAYAYFRWLDDTLDEVMSSPAERLALVERQQALVRDGYVRHLTAEEALLLELLQRDSEPGSGLQTYVQHMMAVMAFDAERRGRLITQQELDNYTWHLATAVTEALHYYIGHNSFAPCDETRYLAVAAAHITHMLRDTCQDITAGYYNIPSEFLTAHNIDPEDLHSSGYQAWVKQRVHLAQTYFRTGKAYLAQVESRRCRLAGYAYMARFEGVLDAIEREGYQLRAEYNERKRPRAVLRMMGSVLALVLTNHPCNPSRIKSTSHSI